jgi:carbamate kinase
MMQEIQKPILLVALGGNALIRKGEEGTVDQQFKNLAVPIRQVARLSKDYRIIITHGNGPQVANYPSRFWLPKPRGKLAI